MVMRMKTNPLTPYAPFLGISSADTDDILCSITSMFLLTVRFLDTVTRTRRRIERTL